MFANVAGLRTDRRGHIERATVVVMSESVARRCWRDRRDWQLVIVDAAGCDFFRFCFFLLLLVVDDNDSFRIAVHITLMGRWGARGGRRGLHIRILLRVWVVCRSVAGVLGFGWRSGREGGRGPRSRGASEVGADHVEVEAVVVGGGDRCPPRRERSHGRVSGRAEKNAPPTLRVAATSVCVVGTSFLPCCDCHRVQLCHNRRAPRKSRPRAATSLTAGRQSAWVQSSSSSSSWDGVGRFFLRVSKLFGSQPR